MDQMRRDCIETDYSVAGLAFGLEREDKTNSWTRIDETAFIITSSHTDSKRKNTRT
jgi:hypothetical protein